ncbi:hypothetical protein IJJ37_00855 [Candidatus Saccharibacteria bacterium]|nr:hypothetical protein [Candidatus Saccharibacteria bacterium]
MAKLNYIHSEETRRDWPTHSIEYQMGNIGSEVSRSLKWTKQGNANRALTAIDRALELFDLTIASNIKTPQRLREVLIAREEFCDYFFGSNSWHTDPAKLQKYYDGFAIMLRLNAQHPKKIPASSSTQPAPNA